MNFNVTPDFLELIFDADDVAAIAEWKKEKEIKGNAYSEYDCLRDVFEDFFCNSDWNAWPPDSRMHEYLGALTDGMIITKEHSENDDGEITDAGLVFWHEAYQVQNLIEAALRGKGFLLNMNTPDQKPSAPKQSKPQSCPSM